MIERTRYGTIYRRDLSDWRVWHDGTKSRYETHDFWGTLDSKAVGLTFKLPLFLGFPLRLVLALLGSNRYEPTVIGNREAVSSLWEDHSGFYRWFWWHVRNPFSDLRKFYMGFAYAIDVDHRKHPWGWVRWARFQNMPWRVPFPMAVLGPVHIGWEGRGILSAGINGGWN